MKKILIFVLMIFMTGCISTSEGTIITNEEKISSTMDNSLIEDVKGIPLEEINLIPTEYTINGYSIMIKETDAYPFWGSTTFEKDGVQITFTNKTSLVGGIPYFIVEEEAFGMFDYLGYFFHYDLDDQGTYDFLGINTE